MDCCAGVAVVAGSNPGGSTKLGAEELGASTVELERQVQFNLLLLSMSINVPIKRSNSLLTKKFVRLLLYRFWTQNPAMSSLLLKNFVCFVVNKNN